MLISTLIHLFCTGTQHQLHFCALYQAFKLLGISVKISILTKLCEGSEDYKILRNHTEHLNCDGSTIHKDILEYLLPKMTIQRALLPYLL